MKKVLLVLVTVALLTSCGKSLRSAGGEVTGVRSVAFNEPAPYGMVLVKRGSFEMGPADKDSLWGIMPETKGVSFDAFWMDQTEVTNAKYRQFVYYVRDSIIRERLADPAYGGNDLFKITEDRYGEPVTDSNKSTSILSLSHPNSSINFSAAAWHISDAHILSGAI